MSLPETSDGGGFSMFSMPSSPIRPDRGPFAFDRADLDSRWVSGRDLDNFSMQGIGPQGSGLA